MQKLINHSEAGQISLKGIQEFTQENLNFIEKKEIFSTDTSLLCSDPNNLNKIVQ